MTSTVHTCQWFRLKKLDDYFLVVVGHFLRDFPLFDACEVAGGISKNELEPKTKPPSWNFNKWSFTKSVKHTVEPWKAKFYWIIKS